MIKIVAENILKKTEDLEKLLDWFKELAEETRKEKGCIEYEIFQGIKNDKMITFIEVWENMEALGEHVKTDHFIRISSKLKDYFDGEGQLNIYKKLI